MINLEGMKCGKLVVTEQLQKVGSKTEWLCKCSCGGSLWVEARRIRDARVYNCGACESKLGGIVYGTIAYSKEGSACTIVSSKGKAVTLRSTGLDFVVSVSNLKTGRFSDPFFRSVCGVGFFGVGPFVARQKNASRHTREYTLWSSMIKRCYGPNKTEAYADVTVCSLWHNFQNFAEWVVQQKGYNDSTFQLDKDLLVRGNKVYSQEHCTLVPRIINAFIKPRRFNNQPLGVDLIKGRGGLPVYRAQIGSKGATIYLGLHGTVEPAFLEYKRAKELEAKQLATEWQGAISDAAYSALMKYTVNIND